MRWLDGINDLMDVRLGELWAPGDLPDSGIEPKFTVLLHLQAGPLPLVPLGKGPVFRDRI